LTLLQLRNTCNIACLSQAQSFVKTTEKAAENKMAKRPQTARGGGPKRQEGKSLNGLSDVYQLGRTLSGSPRSNALIIGRLVSNFYYSIDLQTRRLKKFLLFTSVRRSIREPRPRPQQLSNVCITFIITLFVLLLPLRQVLFVLLHITNHGPSNFACWR
jgi:hypothetical protein